MFSFHCLLDLDRLKHVGYHIARYPVNIARYTMLTHRKEKANPKRYESMPKQIQTKKKSNSKFFRYEKLVNGVKKFDTEGLNSLKYKVHLLEKKPLYTWILVEIKQDSVGLFVENDIQMFAHLLMTHFQFLFLFSVRINLIFIFVFRYFHFFHRAAD